MVGATSRSPASPASVRSCQAVPLDPVGQVEGARTREHGVLDVGRERDRLADRVGELGGREHDAGAASPP